MSKEKQAFSYLRFSEENVFFFYCKSSKDMYVGTNTGVIGLAWVGTACSSYRYEISEDHGGSVTFFVSYDFEKNWL